MFTIRQLLEEGTKRLQQFPSSRLDAELLLGVVLHITRLQIYLEPEKKISEHDAQCYFRFIERRQKGEPIAYIRNHKEFWSLDFYVDSSVLIPRADTELAVEVVLDSLNLPNAIVLDLGTGSGAIACALAHTKPNWQLVASDYSAKSLAVARKNIQQLSLGNIQTIQTHWFKGYAFKIFDAIVSNPPYIDPNDNCLLEPELQFEPKEALVAPDAGLEALRIIVQEAPEYLKAEGILVLEHGATQGRIVRSLLQDSNFKNIKTFQDLAGLDRVTLGTLFSTI